MTDSVASLQLPEIARFQQACRHEDGWSDHYGALHVAAAYAGLPMPQRYLITAIWQHGCMGPWESTGPGPLLFNSPLAGKTPAFVARQDQVGFLTSHGISGVRAIGLPILYTPTSEVLRMPRSLLVMPTHTLVGAKFEDRETFDRYADEISAIAPRFDRVVICLHPSCWRNGLWVREFKSRGFPIVLGAETNDRNALLRMRLLFGQFEALTSNGWGSHIAYGLTFGAKVSIYGSEVVDTVANALLDRTWAANVNSLEALRSEEVQARKREVLQRLFRHPADGLLDVEWGRWFTGATHQVSPAEMRDIWRQMVRPLVPAPGASAPPVEHRRRVQADARELAAVGRSEEAVQLLLRFVRAAVDTKDLRFILETLVEVATNLESLDKPKAAYLRQQARELAVRLKPAVRP